MMNKSKTAAHLTFVSSSQAPLQLVSFDNVRPSTDEIGLVSHHGFLPSGSPRFSSSSWALFLSRSPVDFSWRHIGAERPPNMPAGSPSPAVSKEGQDIYIEWKRCPPGLTVSTFLTFLSFTVPTYF